MLVLGGMGNIPGVIVGSLVISSLDRFILPQLTNFMHGFGISIDLTNSRFQNYGVILVLTMLFRPEGLIPSRQRKAELRAGPDVLPAEQTLYTEAAP
jgi:branched-chain amino acid transport system permease protein